MSDSVKRDACQQTLQPIVQFVGVIRQAEFGAAGPAAKLNGASGAPQAEGPAAAAAGAMGNRHTMLARQAGCAAPGLLFQG
jgi:hypothetical protein